MDFIKGCIEVFVALAVLVVSGCIATLCVLGGMLVGFIIFIIAIIDWIREVL